MIYELGAEEIVPLDRTKFEALGVKERGDLQRLLRANFSIIDPDVLVFAEEFGSWDDSQRRIDLLGLDKDANLVVIELKRTQRGGYMELQALRYAPMVATLTFSQVVEIYQDFLERNDMDADAETAILEHLDWDEPNEDEFGQDLRIILASADFSKELIASVLWLNDRQLNIQCVRFRPYTHGGRTLLDVQRVIPLPESEDFQIRMKEKSERKRQARREGSARTKFAITIDGHEILGLPKRRLMYYVMKGLLETGKSGETICESMPRRGGRALRWYDGDVTSEEFKRRREQDLRESGKEFKPRAWYCEDEDLIRTGDRTYSVSKRWGTGALDIIDSMLSTFSDVDISYRQE